MLLVGIKLQRRYGVQTFYARILLRFFSPGRPLFLHAFTTCSMLLSNMSTMIGGWIWWVNIKFICNCRKLMIMWRHGLFSERQNHFKIYFLNFILIWQQVHKSSFSVLGPGIFLSEQNPVVFLTPPFKIILKSIISLFLKSWYGLHN